MSNNSAKIVALAMQRMPPKDIALRLNVHPNTVYLRIRQARQAGKVIPAFNAHSPSPSGEPETSGSTKQLVVSMRLYSLLVTEAERRGLTPTEAAQRLLEKALLGTVVA